MLRSLKKMNTSNPELNKVQDNIAEVITNLTSNPILSGVLVENIVLTFGSTTTVNHGLGRKVRGWIITAKNNAVDVYALDANQVYPTKQLILSTSATATISLWVF